MAAELDLHVRGDPSLDLYGDAVVLAEGDYERLRNLPSLNGTVLVGDLTLEDVGIAAGGAGATERQVQEAVEEALEGSEMTDEELDGILGEE